MSAQMSALYREFTPLALWARVLAWGATAGVGLSILLAPPAGSSPSVRLPTALGLLMLGAAIEVFLGGLTTEVHRDYLRLHLGRFALLRKQVPLSKVKHLESVTYRPLREFGGWGIRGFGRRQAWTARGNKAVVVTLEDGSQLYVGSDNPQHLESRLRAILQTSG
jgi:hypothetical protein